MTRYGKRAFYEEALVMGFAFRDLVRFSGLHVRAVAALAILFCVVCAMGLGGIVLWFWELASSSVDGVSSPYGLAQWVRIAVGVPWVLVVTVAFMMWFLRSFLPRPSLRPDADVEEVIRTSEELLARTRSG